MNVSVRKRARQQAMLMKAEMDGRGQAVAAPAFTEPAQLKARVPNDDDPPFWFAVWNVRYNVAYALDAYEDELIPYERALRSARRDVADRFAGPFDSEQRAQAVAIERLTMHRKRLGTARRRGD
jgi:hypothetical protein